MIYITVKYKHKWFYQHTKQEYQHHHRASLYVCNILDSNVSYFCILSNGLGSRSIILTEYINLLPWLSVIILHSLSDLKIRNRKKNLFVITDVLMLIKILKIHYWRNGFFWLGSGNFTLKPTKMKKINSWIHIWPCSMMLLEAFRTVQFYMPHNFYFMLILFEYMYSVNIFI